MRRTLQRKKGEDRASLNMLIPVSLDAKLREYADAHDETITAVVVRGIRDTIEESQPEIADGRPSENAITITLTPADIEDLRKLSDNVLHIDDVNLFMKSLARAAISAGPENVYKLIYSRLDRAREAQKAADKKPVEAAVKPARLHKAA